MIILYTELVKVEIVFDVFLRGALYALQPALHTLLGRLCTGVVGARWREGTRARGREGPSEREACTPRQGGGQQREAAFFRRRAANRPLAHL